MTSPKKSKLNKPKTVCQMVDEARNMPSGSERDCLMALLLGNMIGRLYGAKTELEKIVSIARCVGEEWNDELQTIETYARSAIDKFCDLDKPM